MTITRGTQVQWLAELNDSGIVGVVVDVYASGAALVRWDGDEDVDHAWVSDLAPVA